MAFDVNSAHIVGHVGKDPEVRNMPSGTTSTNFSVGVSRSYKNKDGEFVKDTDWFNVTTYGKLQEVVQNYVGKGSHVYVSGRMHPWSQKKDDGEYKNGFELIANELVLLDKKGEGRAAAPVVDESAELPF